ncbi:hypothetical protein PAF15_00815 [Weissella koreensis]|uniref:hypothetical protein n=1 Tax=Weissella koreensis TaxID=165096 RepID=UPI0022BA63F9|nr:hypothetical protein [Weissella koreensis]MCZ9310520.1 hypothetical protein [Weissella koreensis]
MAYSKEEVSNWIEDLHLSTWGPTTIDWNEKVHRVHISVEYGRSEEVRKEIEKSVQSEIDNETTDKDNAQDFLDHLYVTDYMVED